MKRLLSTQPVAVWAVGFAAVVSFMGLGLNHELNGSRAG